MASKVARAAVLAALACGLVACGEDRSVEAYCGALEKHKSRYLSEMNAASDGLDTDDAATGLVSIVRAVGAVGDLSQMWEELAETAPSEIQSDVEAVRDAWDEIGKKATDDPLSPLQGFASGLMTGFMNIGPMSRVEAWTQSNCS